MANGHVNGTTAARQDSLPPVRIYCLADPRNNRPVYVGRTWQPLQLRLEAHICETRGRGGRTAKQRWITELLDQGVKPTIAQIEEVAFEDWQEAEGFWIDYLRSFCGLTLLNQAPAGAGGTRSHVVDWTPELDALLGKVADAIIAERLGVSRKTVTYRRRKLRRPAAYDRTRNVPPPPMGGWNRIVIPDELIRLLGSKPDYVLAAEFGISKRQVGRLRRKFGVPSCAERTGSDGKYRKGNFPQRWLKKR